jgi:hypothetical protein
MRCNIRYGLKEHQKHGEAGSVDLAAVEKEHVHIAKVLAACKGNLTDLRRELHLSLAKGNPK